jgi:hypothetical protein
MLDQMGLVALRGGFARLLAPQSVILKEVRGLAERFAAIRAGDSRRLSALSSFLSMPGCRAASLAERLGDPEAAPCGRCRSCTERGVSMSQRERLPPARRFTVTTVESPGSTFHTDRVRHVAAPLTAKLGEFR